MNVRGPMLALGWLALCGAPLLAGDVGPDAWPQPTAEPVAYYVGGVQVHEPDHGQWVDALARSGMNTVAVTAYARQGAWDGAELRHETADPAVLSEIRAAKARGLAVALVLRVALQHGSDTNKFLWHGQIMPATPALVTQWFERYTAFVLAWAQIAEREGVDVLAIGSEMKALVDTLPVTRLGYLRRYHAFRWYLDAQRRRIGRFADRIEPRHLWVRGYDNYDDLRQYLNARHAHQTAWAERAYLRREAGSLARFDARRRLLLDAWIRLIARVRTVYGGRLTYAANFDSFHRVGFWPQLDFVGINAYFSLRDDLEERQADRRTAFAARWRAILDRIARFKASQDIPDHPVLFTELGYTFRRHSTVEPWAHDGFSVVGWRLRQRRLVVWSDEPRDYGERADALEALGDAHRDTPEAGLCGILYWKLSTDAAHETIEPFVLHVGEGSNDPTVEALARFSDGNASRRVVRATAGSPAREGFPDTRDPRPPARREP